MEKYYHFTSEENINSIMQNGLIPQSGVRTQAIGDSRSGVFLAKGIENSIVMFAAIYYYYLTIDDHISYIEKEKNDLELEEKSRKRYFEKNIIRNKIADLDKISLIYNQIKTTRLPDVLLSINTNLIIDETYPENCCYEGVIAPNNINVVKLVNGNTGESTYSIDLILSYLIKNYPIDVVCQNDDLNYRKYVKYLYNSFNNNFDFNGCYLTEESIYYYKQEQQIKTLN